MAFLQIQRIAPGELPATAYVNIDEIAAVIQFDSTTDITLKSGYEIETTATAKQILIAIQKHCRGLNIIEI